MKIGPYGNGDNLKYTDCILDLQWNTKIFNIPLNPLLKVTVKGKWYGTMRNRNIAIRHNKIAFLGAAPDKTNQIFICDADLNVEKTLPAPNATRASMSLFNFSWALQGHDVSAGRFTIYWNEEDGILVSSTGDGYSYDWVEYSGNNLLQYIRNRDNNASSYFGIADGNPIMITPRPGHYNFRDGLYFWRKGAVSVDNKSNLGIAPAIYSLKNNPTYVSDATRHVLITPSLDFTINNAEKTYVGRNGVMVYSGLDKADGIQLTSIISVAGQSKPVVEWTYHNINYVIRFSQDANYYETPICMDENFVYCLAHPKLPPMKQAADTRKTMVILIVNKKTGQLVREIQTNHSPETAYNWISKISVSNNIMVLYTYNAVKGNLISAINLDTGAELWKQVYPVGSIPHEYNFRAFDPRQNLNHIVSDNKYTYFCYLKDESILCVDRFELLTGSKKHWEQKICEKSIYTTYNLIDEVCIDNDSLYVLVTTGEAHKTQTVVNGAYVTTIKGHEQLLIRIT